VTRYLLSRLIQVAVVVVLVTTISFFLIHRAPGDPFAEMVNDPLVTPEMRAHWMKAYGLDRPLPEQFAKYVVSVARGDLGWSHSLKRPVAHVLRDALPNTLLLMSVALFASFAVGIGLAVAQVRKPGSLTDRVVGGVLLFFFSVPEFLLALMLLILFTYQFPIWFGHGLPIGGMTDAVVYESFGPIDRLIDIAKHTILPALTLTLVFSAVVARYQRAALLDVLPSEFVKTARAKGVPERIIVRHHALRNALLPTISLFGLAFPALLTGAVFVEKVFGWPGMGLIIVGSISTRDYPLLMSSVIIGAVLVGLGSLLADMLYLVADPRLRHDR
jgi:peptide/nickel transport system permease protein